MHVGQVQVEQDDVVIIQLAQIQALFPEVRRIDVETFGRQHKLDRLCRGRFIFDQKHPHVQPLFARAIGTVQSSGPKNGSTRKTLTIKVLGAKG
jgi:hypothetical protein